ncbi:MAG TPA: patatin-like phospholipase family protein [Polyangiales bacterium]|nr:patatin-like phospholipase family protein [Polyangiales bacterium]
MTTGIVMSGGGARGSYEVGVLTYLYGEFTRHFGHAPTFDVISGTSVGAVNGTALAATANDPVAGMRLLANVWLEQALSDVMRLDLRHLPRLYRLWLGGGMPSGLFDSRPLARLISYRIPWRQLARNLRSNRVQALTVSATNVRTGRSTLYVDRAKGVDLPRGGTRIGVLATHILPQHVLASAAMPLVFPPVRIGNDYYCDGGIRLNTPTAPAIQMGVDRMFVIGVTTPRRETSIPLGHMPGASFLLGKALDALMLDHIEHDLEELRLINEVLSDAYEAGGADFPARMQSIAAAHGRPPRRRIKTFVIHPSMDIGLLASQHLRNHRPRLSRLLGHTALRLLDVGEGADADLASYVMFDGDFARALIDLGQRDAARHRDELAEFLFSDPGAQ